MGIRCAKSVSCISNSRYTCVTAMAWLFHLRPSPSYELVSLCSGRVRGWSQSQRLVLVFPAQALS